MPEWIDTETDAAPTDQQVQQLISAERGYPGAGQRRRWYRPDADVTVLIVDELGLRISRDDGTTAPAAPIVVGSPAGGALVGTYPNPTLAPATIDTLLPPGTIWAYGGDTPPVGWLRCDGAAVSRTTYAKLFAVIGTTYGPGDGVSTFNVPTLTGRMLLGESGSHARGQTGGSETAAGLPHTHPGSHGHGLNSHTHGVSHTHPGSHDHGVTHTHPGAHDHDVSENHTHTNGHEHELDIPLFSTEIANVDSVAVGYATPALGSGLFDHHHEVLGWTVTTGTTDPDDTGNNGPFVTDDATIAHDASITTTASASPAHAASIPATATPSPATTATDATVHPADYGASTIATLPPFGVALYMIRAGA